LAKQYVALCNRDISKDTDLILAAQNFANSLKNLRFADLALQKGFDYTNVIAALSQLAGRNETLVHKLSINGAAQLECEDDGLVPHPRESIAEMLYGPCMLGD
jgi:hypothetical protein